MGETIGIFSLREAASFPEIPVCGSQERNGSKEPRALPEVDLPVVALPDCTTGKGVQDARSIVSVDDKTTRALRQSFQRLPSAPGFANFRIVAGDIGSALRALFLPGFSGQFCNYLVGARF
jgi:hypothetical protein